MNSTKKFTVLFLVAIIVLASCPQIVSALNSEWSYTIISDTNYHQIKRTVEIRLSERISEKVLTELAQKLKALDPKTYERTFMTYYLPDMKVGHGAWATTHYDPKLKVQILGTTKEENEKLTATAQKKNKDRELIGSWYIEAPYTSRTLTLFRKDSKVFLERTFTDGSGSVKEMTETKTPNGMKYKEVGTDSDSDYYLINSKGLLELHDSYGLIDTGKKI
jgi:hypothetical protein